MQPLKELLSFGKSLHIVCIERAHRWLWIGRPAGRVTGGAFLAARACLIHHMAQDRESVHHQSRDDAAAVQRSKARVLVSWHFSGFTPWRSTA